jgi:hypothetical protein
MRLIPSHHGESLSVENEDTVHESATQFLMLMSGYVVFCLHATSQLTGILLCSLHMYR